MTIVLVGLVTVVRLVLAGVFLVAGLAKLADRSGTRTTIVAFGAPEWTAGTLAILLPIAELAAASLLLPGGTAVHGGVVALALLLLFSVAIAVNLARGAPECHCFGQLHSAPAGWRTLARNAALAAVAAVVVVVGRDDPGPGAFAWVSHLDGVDWLVLALAFALVGVVGVGGYAVMHVMRGYGRVLVRLEAVEERLRAAGFELEDPDDIPELGLAPGTTAPPFELMSIEGSRISLENLREPGNPVLLLFTSPTCGPCSVLMSTIADWQREHYGELTIALVSDGDPDAIRIEAAEHELVNVLVDDGLSTYEVYQANGTPSAVLIGDDGNIASWLAAGSEWIESLVQQSLAGLGRTPGLPIGSPLPQLRLSQLDGNEVALADVVERESVLLFWNPGCGFCRSLHEDILAWQASPPVDAPALVVVSSGDVVGVKAEGFASRVLLDPKWTVSSALGADGTPMAVLVSADGRIASGVVGGGPAVLELLGHGELATAR